MVGLFQPGREVDPAVTSPQVNRIVGSDALRVGETAQALGITPPLVRELIGVQWLPAVKPAGSQWQVNRRAVALLRRTVSRIRQLSK